VVWSAVAVDLLGFGIIIPLLPLYAERFGASPLTIGVLFASYSLSQFVLAPLWGRISDKVGRRPILLVAIAGSAVGSLTLGLAGSLGWLFVGRIIDGGSGASIAIARATVADMADPAERPRLMGLLGAAFGVGFVIGPIIGSLAALGSPALPFLVAATIALINLVIGFFRIPETLRPEAVSTSQNGTQNLPSPAFRLITLTLIGVTAFGAFEATFALLGSSRLGMTGSTVAIVFAGVGTILVFTQAVLVGRSTKRLGERRVLQIGLGLNVAGFAALSMATTWPSLLAGLMLLALGQGLLTPTLSSAIAGIVPGRSGAALGAQQSAAGLGRVIGPLLGGGLFAVAIPLPYAVAGALTLAAFLLVPSRLEPAASAPTID
jgi:MFS transporter, DHA1 family, tetracycline resistance protein